MHEIGYLVYRKTQTTPKQILKKLNKFAFDPYETDHYHGNLHFHEKPVYKNAEEARKAIERLDNGWYDDHAVLYKEGRVLMWLVKYEYHC